MTLSIRCRTASAALLTALLTVSAQARDMEDAPPAPQTRQGMAQLGDPYVPPRVRASARSLLSSPASTLSLQDRALGKLKKKFDEADIDNSGRVSQARAAQAGFGYLADHFAEIDIPRRGSISFEQLKTFMRAKGARF
ncbi:EF-hand domain-containing protein [Paludibacterium yongneupense]|uniref:EF-hand domain-containing protein n=1 Tax=Paludibacterium yongneupense TaxID=400061 RepID=UPI0012EB140C|nr:EF-hand domain-containing protein [Paludibacterium yongneupense]